MKVSKELINKVIRNKIAADPAQETKGTPAQIGGVKYYFYDVAVFKGTSSDINYSGINETITKATDANIIKDLMERLDHGITGNADNFAWKYLVMKNNNYKGKIVIYYCQIESSGKKMQNPKLLSSDGSVVDAKEFEDTNGLYKDMGGAQYIIIDKGTNSFFVKGMPNESNIKQLLTSNLKFPSQMGWTEFNHGQGDYRMFFQNRLVKPDYSEPEDAFKTPADLNKIKQIANKRIQQLDGKKETVTPSLGDKIKKEPLKNEGPMTMDKANERFSTKLEQDENGVYSGGSDIMKQLVKKMRKNMSTWKQNKKEAALAEAPLEKELRDTSKAHKTVSQKLRPVDRPRSISEENISKAYQDAANSAKSLTNTTQRIAEQDRKLIAKVITNYLKK
jgi:hypothetical protein